MRKDKLILAGLVLGFTLIANPLYAAGGGGIEYTTSVGSDLLSRLGVTITGTSALELGTGDLLACGGFGYSVNRQGYKVGGFGFGFGTPNVDQGVSYGSAVRSFSGGVGGVINGLQGNLGPLVLAFNTRVGVGGYNLVTATEDRSGLLLHLAADAELGVSVFSWFLISAFGGASANILFGQPLLDAPMVVPEVGIRLSWGSFR